MKIANSSTVEPTVKLELNQAEAQAFIELLDAAARATGIKGAAAVTVFMTKLEPQLAVFQSKTEVKTEAEPAQEPPARLVKASNHRK